MRILKYAIKNIQRNVFLSFSSVLVLTLIIFFINILMLVSFTTDELIKNINSRLTISITLRKWFSNENSEVVELISWIKAVSKNLNVTYISPEEALSTISARDPELLKVVESDSENPLPASIKVENIWLIEYSAINDVISVHKWAVVYDENKFKKNITWYKQQYDKIDGVIKVFHSIRLWIYSIIGLFIFSVFIIIYNIIGNFIFFYRDEIKITKLVWWDNIFIYWPFSFQWLLYTLFSGLLSLMIFLYIIKTINIYLIDDFPKFINMFLSTYWLFFVYEILWISFIWMLSWFLSSHKFINKTYSKK